MFEDSMVVSQLQPVSSTKRWTALASMGLQFAVAALVIALPLLHPERLAFKAAVPRIVMPPLQRPPVVVEATHASSTGASMETPLVTRTFTAPPMLPKLLPQTGEAPSVLTLPFGKGMDDEAAIGAAIGDVSRAPRIAVRPAAASNGPLHVSSGVSAGMLIAPIRPIYPDIARIARVEGTVVVEAIISRTGTVEGLHVVSGPAMLQQAALDAIRTARYQPYRLNGSPTEVSTTITVNFRLGT